MKTIYSLLTFLLISLTAYSQTCQTPSNMTFTNITSTTADVSWNENNVPAATLWDLELLPCGAVPTGIPTHPNVTANPYTFTGLSPFFPYSVYVRSACSANNNSTWFTAACFTTLGPTNTNEVNKTNKHWSIFPNPANGNISIRSTMPEAITRIEILDISGKVIQIFADHQLSVTPITIRDLSRGLYFCKISNAKNQFEIEKIVVQ